MHNHFRSNAVVKADFPSPFVPLQREGYAFIDMASAPNLYAIADPFYDETSRLSNNVAAGRDNEKWHVRAPTISGAFSY